MANPSEGVRSPEARADDPARRRFAQLCARPDSALDLATGALLCLVDPSGRLQLGDTAAHVHLQLRQAQYAPRQRVAILVEAGLAFLGLGDPNSLSWGLAIGRAREFFTTNWWAVTFPGLAIFLTVLGLSLVGDGLQDAYNPKLRGR